MYSQIYRYMHAYMCMYKYTHKCVYSYLTTLSGILGTYRDITVVIQKTNTLYWGITLNFFGVLYICNPPGIIKEVR